MNTLYLSREQVRAVDRRAMEEFGLPGVVLMENAGRGCAELVMRFNPERRPTTIVCGPGNNGGDGFVIARHLHNQAWPVRVFAFPGSAWPADALANLNICQKMMDVQFWSETLRTELWDTLTVQGWIVDALFGTGLSRGIGEPFVELIERINAAPNPVLAVDIPSGLDCDSGDPLGPTIQATHTATFVAKKVGFANSASRTWTGDVHVVDIGVPTACVRN
jgi:NAD(P)H-hydrate epimerase